MKRDIKTLESTEFDVLVIGAGVHGACVARDASLRGLKVALIDQGDICGATSHNSLKTIHGGIRYLQHLNFRRTLSSIREQTIWLRTAPKRVKPMPFMMPTYGHGMRGPLAMLAGIILYAIVGIGRNKGLKADSRIRAGRVVSKQRCLSIAQGLPKKNLSGAAIWNDAQVSEADQTVLEIAEDAYQHGAVVANYIKAIDFVSKPQESHARVNGARVIDVLSQKEFNIKARCVVNASGPWLMHQLTQSDLGEQFSQQVPLVKSMNVVTRRALSDHALSFYSQHQSDSVLGNTKRLYFVVPWKGAAIFGTTHFPHQGNANDLDQNAADVQSFIDEINAGYPALNLGKEDVLYCYQGLTPADAMDDSADKAQRLHESKVVDHRQEDNVDGVVSIISIKWTTARLVAEQCTDLVSKKLDHHKSCVTRTRPIPELKPLRTLSELSGQALEEQMKAHIDTTLACHLDDVLLRRTDDFVLEKLTLEQLKVIADTLSQQLGWTTQVLKNEIASLSDRVLSEHNHQLIKQVLEAQS